MGREKKRETISLTLNQQTDPGTSETESRRDKDGRKASFGTLTPLQPSPPSNSPATATPAENTPRSSSPTAPASAMAPLVECPSAAEEAAAAAAAVVAQTETAATAAASAASASTMTQAMFHSPSLSPILNEDESAKLLPLIDKENTEVGRENPIHEEASAAASAAAEAAASAASAEAAAVDSAAADVKPKSRFQKPAPLEIHHDADDVDDFAAKKNEGTEKKPTPEDVDGGEIGADGKTNDASGAGTELEAAASAMEAGVDGMRRRADQEEEDIEDGPKTPMVSLTGKNMSWWIDT